jgi:hypothetical protein
MFRYWKTSLLMLVFLAGSCLVYCYRVPQLVVEDVNAGDCEGEGVVYRTVEVQNTGWARLRIDGIELCCGSELPEGYPSSVPPRRSTRILVKVKTGTASNSAGAVFERTVKLRTNDPDSPIKPVTIRGRDNTPLKMKTNMNFGYILPGYSSELSFITTDDEISMSSLCFAASSPHIAISKLSGSDQQQCKYVLQFDESIPRGNVNEYVYVKTNSSRRPYVVFPVHAVVERGIRVRPETILLTNDKSTQELKRTVRITVLNRDWQDIVQVECSNKSVRLDLEKTSQDRYRLECALDASSCVDGLKASVVLRNGRGEELCVPVLCYK